MARNHASARPAQRKADKSNTKKIVQSSAPRAPLPTPTAKPEPVKRIGELPVPRATYFL